MIVNEELYDPKTTAQYIKLAPSTLANWRCAGRGPKYIKLGGRVLYRKSAVDAYLDACVREPEGRV